MPSSKSPTSVVQPGSGRLPASTVTASSLVFPGGGGGGGSMAALMAHVADTVDAHMAGAIGIPPAYPPTGESLLTSAVPPGVIDGESVLDFIAQFKDLLPERPQTLGNPGGVNSSVPSWGSLGTARKGGYRQGANTVMTRYVADAGTTSFTISGMVYPADRGVLALYRKTDGDFTNPFSSATLVAVLHLGASVAAPSGMPTAAFDDFLRKTNQLDYTASGLGLDRIGLQYRYPYASSYPSGVPYAPYGVSFSSFQLATFSVTQSVASGGLQSWFLVHWRDSFATSLTAIDPSGLSLASLTTINCFSAVPSSAADFDDGTKPVFAVGRHNVFGDALSGTVPTLGTISTALTASKHKLSGVEFYDGGASLNWTVVLNALFGNAFLLGGGTIPAEYQTAYPVVLRLGGFGSPDVSYRYDQLDNGVTTTPFSLTNPPLPGDQGRRQDAALPVASTPYTANSFTDPYTLVRVTGANVWQSADFPAPTKYLWNSWDHTGSAGTQGGYNMATTEKFVDESYRYVSTHAPVGSDPIKPTGLSAHDSTLLLSSDTAALQVIGDRLVYPKLDLSVGYDPVGPNYSTLPGSDGLNHRRRYVRAFTTGIPRNTGRLRIRGLLGPAFTVNAPYDGQEITGHLTGGAIIHVKVPGLTGWLDLGRPLGDPGLATLDYYGCSTGIQVVGPDVVVSFQTTAQTVNNGAGEYPLFVRVSFLNNASGLGCSLDELEWLAP